ncbi:MAG: YceI family protein [Bdellovibrionaceae bacterium]|nr:YceI family protein [Bdellovibrio sp.]
MTRFLVGLAILFFSFVTNAMTELQSVPPHGQVQFDAVGRPSMLKIKGEAIGAIANLSVTDHNLNGTIKFDLNALKTGIDLRDEHMKDKYLQVKQGDNAIATLTFTDFPIPLSWTAAAAKIPSWTFRAMLHLHGVDREITGNYSIGSNKMDTIAKFDIKLSDFKIDIPTYLGVKVADIVNVVVSFPEMKLTERSVPQTNGPKVDAAAASAAAPAKVKKK